MNVIDRLLYLESKLRDVSTKLQYGEVKDVKELRKFFRSISYIVEELYEDLTSSSDIYFPKIDDVIESLNIISEIFEDIEEGRVTDKSVRLINEIRSIVRDITGRECCYFDWNSERRSLSAYLNDLASCIHGIAKYLMDYFTKGEYCIYLSSDCDEKIRDLCWKIEELGKKYENYGRSGSSVFIAIGHDRELQVRTNVPIGVPDGHVVNMYAKLVNDNELEVDYTMWDGNEVEVVEKYVKEGKCRGMLESGGSVKCKFTIEEFLRFIEEILKSPLIEVYV